MGSQGLDLGRWRLGDRRRRPGPRRGAVALVDRHRWPSRAVASPCVNAGPAPGPIVACMQDLDGDQLAAVASIMGNQVRTAGPAAWWIVTAGHRGPWRHRGVNAGPAPGSIVTAAIEGRGVTVASTRGRPPIVALAGPRRGPARGRGVDHGSQVRTAAPLPGGSSPAAGASTGMRAAGRSIMGNQVRTARPAAWWIVTAAIEGRGVTVASTRGRTRADRRLMQDLDGDQLAAGRSIMDSQGLDVGQPLGTLLRKTFQAPTSPRPAGRSWAARASTWCRRLGGSSPAAGASTCAVALVDRHRWPSRAVASPWRQRGAGAEKGSGPAAALAWSRPFNAPGRPVPDRRVRWPRVNRG